MSEPSVLFERRGAAGVITLNRPQALNALNLEMVEAIDRQLALWAEDAAIGCVAIRGAGGRAFCAGGDVRHLRELALAGRQSEALAFWREEYRLNARIKAYPKPYVALLEGIVMGGGVGLSIHGSYRVACGRITFAMPEAGIGYFPDIGGTYFLPRLAPGVGMWLALTGSRLDAADAAALGILTHRLAAGSVDEALLALAAGGDPEASLRPLGLAREAAPVEARLGIIARCFRGESVEAILVALDEASGDCEHGAFAAEAAATIRSRSPLSLKIAHEQLRRGVRLDLAEALRTELRIDRRIIDSHDFREGIRAVLVDKTNAPAWSPASLSGWSRAAIDAFFAGTGPDELTFEPEIESALRRIG